MQAKNIAHKRLLMYLEMIVYAYGFSYKVELVNLITQAKGQAFQMWHFKTTLLGEKW